MQPLNNKPNWTHVKPTLAGWYFWRRAVDTAVNTVLIQTWNNGFATADFMIAGCETINHKLADFNGGEWLGPVTPDTQRTARDTELYALAEEVIKRHTAQTRVYGHETTLQGKLEHVLREYETTAINALSMAKSFRDALLVDFRAVSMVLTMVSNAATHKEKDSRLRGCMELIESVIGRLQKEEFDVAVCNRPQFHDPFVSDFPSRKFIERIRQLEDENKTLKEAQEAHHEAQKPEVPEF